MGIKGLWKELKPYCHSSNISSFKGKRVGVDFYSWLHKAVLQSSTTLNLIQEGLKTITHNISDDTTETLLNVYLQCSESRYLSYLINRVALLLKHEITPVLVLDGNAMPMKQDTSDDRTALRDAARRQIASTIQRFRAELKGIIVTHNNNNLGVSRKSSLQQPFSLLSTTDINDEAIQGVAFSPEELDDDIDVNLYQKFQECLCRFSSSLYRNANLKRFFDKAVAVNSELAYACVKVLQEASSNGSMANPGKKRVEVIVAPYEADAQLAYLSRLSGVWEFEGGRENSKRPYIDAVITEDGDLILYGCSVMLTKLDAQGFCEVVYAHELMAGEHYKYSRSLTEVILKSTLQHSSTCVWSNFYYLTEANGIESRSSPASLNTPCLKGPSGSKAPPALIVDLSPDAILIAAIMSGCDYLTSLSNIGIKTAIKIVKATCCDLQLDYTGKLDKEQDNVAALNAEHNSGTILSNIKENAMEKNIMDLSLDTFFSTLKQSVPPAVWRLIKNSALGTKDTIIEFVCRLYEASTGISLQQHQKQHQQHFPSSTNMCSRLPSSSSQTSSSNKISVSQRSVTINGNNNNNNTLNINKSKQRTPRVPSPVTPKTFLTLPMLLKYMIGLLKAVYSFRYHLVFNPFIRECVTFTPLLSSFLFSKEKIKRNNELLPARQEKILNNGVMDKDNLRQVGISQHPFVLSSLIGACFIPTEAISVSLNLSRSPLTLKPYLGTYLLASRYYCTHHRSKASREALSPLTSNVSTGTTALPISPKTSKSIDISSISQKSSYFCQTSPLFSSGTPLVCSSEVMGGSCSSQTKVVLPTIVPHIGCRKDRRVQPPLVSSVSHQHLSTTATNLLASRVSLGLYRRGKTTSPSLSRENMLKEKQHQLRQQNIKGNNENQRNDSSSLPSASRNGIEDLFFRKKSLHTATKRSRSSEKNLHIDTVAAAISTGEVLFFSIHDVSSSNDGTPVKKDGWGTSDTLGSSATTATKSKSPVNQKSKKTAKGDTFWGVSNHSDHSALTVESTCESLSSPIAATAVVPSGSFFTDSVIIDSNTNSIMENLVQLK